MFMCLLRECDCEFAEPKIMKTWNIVKQDNAYKTIMCRIKVAVADISVSAHENIKSDLYALVAVNVYKDTDKYSFKAIDYQEGHATNDVNWHYYGVAMPKKIINKAMQLAVEEVKKDFFYHKVAC